MHICTKCCQMWPRDSQQMKKKIRFQQMSKSYCESKNFYVCQECNEHCVSSARSLTTLKTIMRPKYQWGCIKIHIAFSRRCLSWYTKSFNILSIDKNITFMHYAYISTKESMRLVRLACLYVSVCLFVFIYLAKVVCEFL